MRLTEGLVGLVAEQVRPVVVHDTTTHPRFKYFSDAGEDPYRTFLGVPVMDRGVLQGVLVVQTAEAARLRRRTTRMLATAGAQLAPIISEARAVGQFVAPVHQRLAAIAQNLWWSWDDESVSLFRDLDPVVWRDLRPQSDRAAPADADRSARARASQLALHGRINQAYRRLQEYLGVEAHLGRAPRQRPRGPAGGVLLRGVRAARVHADLLGRSRHPRRGSPQERLGPRHSARRRSASTTTRATSASGSIATAGSTRNTSTSTPPAADRSRRRTTACR